MPSDFFRTHPIMVVPHYVDIVLDAAGVETITPFHDRPHVASTPFLGGDPAVAYLDAGELPKLGCYAVEVLGFRVAFDHSFVVKGKFIMFLEASNFVAGTSIPLLDAKFLPLDTVFEFTLGEQVLRPKPNLLALLLASSPIEEVSARPPITEIQKRNKMHTTDGTHEIIFVQTAIATKELAESLPSRRLYGTNPQFEKIVGPYGYHVTAAKVRSVMIDDSRENTVTGRDLLHSLQGLEFWKTDEALEKFLHASFETETGGFSLSWFVDKRLVPNFDRVHSTTHMVMGLVNLQTALEAVFIGEPYTNCLESYISDLSDQSVTQDYDPKYWHFQVDRALANFGNVLGKEPGGAEPRASLFRSNAEGMATRQTAVKLLTDLLDHYLSEPEMNRVRLNWESLEPRFRKRDLVKPSSVSFASSTSSASSSRAQSPTLTRPATPPAMAAAPKSALKEVKMWCTPHLNFIFGIRDVRAAAGSLRSSEGCKEKSTCGYAHPPLNSMPKATWLKLIDERFQKARRVEVRAAVNAHFA